MFGSTSTFGSTAPTFGSASFTGANTASPFGATQQPAATSLFGGTTGFNAPKPTGFGTAFGSPQQQSTSLFGQQNRLGGNTTMFSNPATGSPFGSSVGQAQGTSIQFTAITGSDTMMKNGVASPINTRHQCITCMKEYEQKSLEELRFEDYQLGRKGVAGQQQSGVFGSTQAQPTGLFSSITPASNATTAFGQRAPAFGTVAPQPTTGGLFSNLNQPKPSFFGSTPATNTFGTPSTGFAFPTTQAQPQQSIFGQTNPATSTVGIGGTTGFTFNQPVQQPPTLGLGFGQKPGVSSAPTFGFSTQTNQAMSKPTTLFSSAPSFSTSTGFGTTAPATNIFGTTTAAKPFSFGAPASTGGFTFSNPAVSTAPAFGTSVFGAQTTTTSSTGFPSFSTPFTSNTGGFGGFNTGNTTLPQPSTGFSFSGGNAFAQPNLFQQVATPATGPVPFATTPYMDSPLYYNLVTNRNLETMTKPTNPLAQRAMKEASRRRSSTALNTSVGQSMSLKQMTFPVSKSPSFSRQNSVFDGFEDDEHGPIVDILSPKTSVKKLSLKTVRSIHRLSLPLPTHRSSPTPLGSVSLSDGGSNSVASNLDISDISTNTLEEESVQNGEAGSSQNGLSSPGGTPTSPLEMEGVRRFSPEPLEVSRTEQNGPSATPKFHEHNSDTYVPLTLEEWEKIKKSRKLKSSGLICTIPGYYTQPSVHELDMYTDEDGKCLIRGFCVGRHNFGQVRFLDVVDVAGLNIDEIVEFRHKEVVVYPEDMPSPPVGEGLNVRAQVHLARIWPLNKKTKENIKDVAAIRALKYEDLLRRSCERMDVDFVSYDPEEGVWIFTVKHFSKYSCVPEEDDEEEAITLATKSPGKGLGGLTPAQIKLNCPQIPYCNDRYEQELEPGLVILEHASAYRKMQGLDPQRPVPIMDDAKQQREVPMDKSRSILGNIFFPEETIIADDHGQTDRRYMPIDMEETTGYVSLFEKPSYYTENLEKSTDRDDPSILHDFPPVGVLNQSVMFNTSDITPRYVKKQPRVWNRRREEIHRKPVAGPLELFTKLWIDNSSLHIPPRAARVCMGPKGQFVHILNNPTKSTLVQFNGEVGMKTLNTKAKQMGKVFLTSYKDVLGSQLELYLENSDLSKDTFSVMTADIISDHASKLTTLLGKESPFTTPLGTHLTTILKEEREVWKLVEILTGNGNGLMGSKNQKMEMAQRGRLSKWLRSNGPMLFSKLYQPGDTSVKGYLLKGMKQDASRQAIRDKNCTLALCLVQNDQRTQSQCRSQLEFWEQEGAIPFIDPQLRALYGLCAGYPIWGNVDCNRMSTSEWLQHFATFVWYLSPPHLSIDKIVTYFQSTVRQTALEISDNFSAPAIETADSSLANLCIHLLKMYSSVGYPVNKLLSPKSHTADAFDYKVSWFLLNAFLLIGVQVDSGLKESITIGFAQQLEMLSMWEWSIYILKFLPPTEARRITIRRLLEQHLTLSHRTLPEAELQKKMLVLERLGLSYDDLEACKY